MSQPAGQASSPPIVAQGYQGEPRQGSIHGYGRSRDACARQLEWVAGHLLGCTGAEGGAVMPTSGRQTRWGCRHVDIWDGIWKLHHTACSLMQRVLNDAKPGLRG